MQMAISNINSLSILPGGDMLAMPDNYVMDDQCKGPVATTVSQQMVLMNYSVAGVVIPLRPIAAIGGDCDEVAIAEQQVTNSLPSFSEINYYYF